MTLELGEPDTPGLVGVLFDTGCISISRGKCRRSRPPARRNDTEAD
jgi:hypothetical protein